MAYLTGQTEQGNLEIAELKNGVFECAPYVPYRIKKIGKTNTWHMLHMKAVGKKGEKIKVRITWPSFDPDLVPDEIKNQPNYEIDWESFVTAARDVIFTSDDRVNWHRIDEAVLDGNSIYFETELLADESYFTVTLYYTIANYKNLIDMVKDNEFVKTEIIGTDNGGDEIYAFTVTDFSCPDEEKIAVHLQGAQHCSEFNGAHLCDFMIRYLSGDGGAKELLKKYIFTFIPVTSVTSWRLGLDVHSSGKNPNRDWVDKELESTKAIHKFLSNLKNKPELLLDIHSGLANYGRWDICQALNVNTNLSEDVQAELKRFFDIVYENCSFLPEAEHYWLDPCDDTMFDGYGSQYGQTHTMEISHYAMYDRESGRHFPIDQKGINRFACQLPHAIDLFFETKK